MDIFRNSGSKSVNNGSRSQSAPSLELKEYVRRFTPAWHALVMGTGAITSLFSVFPYGPSRGLQIAALTILVFNIILFIILTFLTIARYILFPELIKPSLLVHPTQSLFLGCFSMGFATILMGAVLVPYKYFGFAGQFLWMVWILWWVDVGASLLICFGQLYLMFTRQTHSLSRMTLMWLLPIVTLIVVSAAGVIVAQSLTSSSSPSPDARTLAHIYLTLAVCTALVSIGLALTLSIIVIYLLRLMVYKLPEGVGLFSVFLPLGPLAQAGFTYVALGEIARVIFPLPSSSEESKGGDGMNGLALNVFANSYSGEVLYVLGWFLGFVLWSFATCWLVLGFLTFGDVLLVSRLNKMLSRRKRRKVGSLKEKSVMGMDPNGDRDADRDGDMGVGVDVKPSSRLPFKVTFWGMIFPNGVYANLTIHLAHTTSSHVLRIWGTIYAVFTIVLWVYALVRTVVSLRDGSVFEELCVPSGTPGASSSSAMGNCGVTGNGIRTGLGLEERLDSVDTVVGSSVDAVRIDVDEERLTVERELFRRFSFDTHGARGGRQV